MLALADRLRKAATALGCSPAEVLALTVLAGAALATLGFLWILAGRPAQGETAVPLEPVEETIVVHVSGDVTAPGLYHLDAAARVGDAITAAGGPLPGASLVGLNLARPLSDGEEVAVRSAEAHHGAEHAAPDAWLPDGRLDLNLATAGDLEALPGVGPVTAQRIVEHRERVGRFGAVTDLRAVPGIGEKRLQALAELVDV